MNRGTRAVLSQLLLTIGVLLAGPGLAADAYKFEMIVFERPAAAVAVAAVDQPEDTAPAQPGPSVVGRLDGFAPAQKTLEPVAYTLRQKGLRVLEYLAWVQVPRGLDSDAWYSIDNGRLSGLVRLTRGRYLHLDADLTVRDARDGAPYRARFNRRMRSDELHYVDNPRLGILIRAARVTEGANPGEPEGPGDGEPLPAEPEGQPTD